MSIVANVDPLPFAAYTGKDKNLGLPDLPTLAGLGVISLSTLSLADITRQTAEDTRARDPRARRSMLSLHEAMLKLIRESAFEDITVDDIAAQAHVGRSTFYRHFATKEELVESIAKAEIDRLVDLTFPLLRQVGSMASCLALAEYVDEHRRLWQLLVNGGASRVMRETFVKQSSTRGVTSLELPPLDIPVNLAAAYGVAAVFEVLSWWLAQSEPAPVEVVADYLDRLAVRPVLLEG